MIFPNKKFYFISGLPRSGSTLLCCILNQNPLFYCSLSSPVLSIMNNLEDFISSDEFYRANPKQQQVHNIISSVINQYYSDVNQSIIFDKNRGWPGAINYIESYIKQSAKIICLVRDINEILASFISLIRKNKNQGGIFDRALIDLGVVINDKSRCAHLMSDEGVVARSLSQIKHALDNNLGDRLLFVEYNDLIYDPHETMKKIYAFLDEEYFNHDFENIIQTEIEDDSEVYGLEDMHTVRKVLKNNSVDPRIILGAEIYKKYKNMEFWRTL
jgi:sulfotransferase